MGKIIFIVLVVIIILVIILIITSVLVASKKADEESELMYLKWQLEHKDNSNREKEEKGPDQKIG